MNQDIFEVEKRDVLRLGHTILTSDRFHKAETTVHHLTTTVADHSIRVAAAALYLTRKLNEHGFHIDEQEVVWCALLHDIGMTEDAVHDRAGFIKCFLHPIRSAEIAREEFDASEEECNAIRCHMWPATVVPPVHLPGWVVIAADKYCSVYEVSHAENRELTPEG